MKSHTQILLQKNYKYGIKDSFPADENTTKKSPLGKLIGIGTIAALGTITVGPDILHSAAEKISDRHPNIAALIEDVGVTINNSTASNIRQDRENMFRMNSFQKNEYKERKARDYLGELYLSGDISVSEQKELFDYLERMQFNDLAVKDTQSERGRKNILEHL